MNYKQHITAITIVPEGAPKYDENGYTLTIEDDAGGPYIVISEHNINKEHNTGIDLDAWPSIKSAMEMLIKICKELEV